MKDTYEVNVEQATKLALFMVDLGKVEEQILLEKAKDGKIPSGIENQNGVIRVSWLKNSEMAKAVLSNMGDKESKKVSPTVEIKEEKPRKTSDFFKKKNK